MALSHRRSRTPLSSRSAGVVDWASRWLLRHRRRPLDIAATIASFSPGVPELTNRLPELLPDAVADTLAKAVARHVDAGVPEPLARQAWRCPARSPCST